MTLDLQLDHEIMNETLRTIYDRRAVRKFKPLPVGQATIEQLLDAGRMAPSAINKQPWRFYVVTSAELIKTMSEEIAAIAEEHFHLSHGVHLSQSGDAIFHGAPIVIFVSASKENEWAPLDIGMCAQNMMLAAKSLGLDSCPVGLGKFVEKTKSYSALKVPPADNIVISVIFGYGDENSSAHERQRDNVTYVS